MKSYSRKRNWPTKQNARDEYPLRGHLICSRCGAKLTGSSSKGNGGKYFYYHCTPKCGERFKAEEVNSVFADTLQSITVNEVSLRILEDFSASMYKNGGQSSEQEAQKLKAEIQKNKERLSNAQQLLLDGTLEPGDYKEIKNRYEPIINQLESRLRNLLQDNGDLDDMIAFSRHFFKKMDKLYLEGNLAVKQQLIGLMFPEKLKFEKKALQTISDNPLIPLICRPSKGLQKKTHKKSPQYVDLSTKAPPTGLISNQLLEDLRKIYELKVVIPISKWKTKGAKTA